MIDRALADAVFAPKAAAVAGEIEALGGSDVKNFVGGAEVVDHPERTADGVEAIAFEHAEPAVECADPELAPEFGQRLDVVAADLTPRREHLVI